MFGFNKKGLGALHDDRHQSLKDLDYKHEEVASAVAPLWLKKTSYRHYPVKDQSNSSSCVANATALIMGIENELEEGEYVDLSARDIYTKRMNMPGEGMYFVDALAIAKNYGATLEVCMPSNGKGEVKMNENIDRKVSDTQIAKVFKAGGYVQLPIDIDTIASVSEKGKGILLGFTFNFDEWTSTPKLLHDTAPLHHGVAGVDFTLADDSKALIIQDSWGLHNTTIKGQRIITEDFLKARCTFAGYLLDLSNDPTKRTFKPSFDGSTKSLQDILKFEGFFPTTIESTGYFGSITKAALIKFQLAHNINPPEGYFGPITKEYLFANYK